MLPLRLMSNTNDNNHVDGLSPEKAFLYNENKGAGFGSANVVNSWQLPVCSGQWAVCGKFTRKDEG